MGRWRYVDATLDRPVFKQIADTLRDDIQSGRLGAGDWLPSEAHLGEEFNAGRNSVRKAISILTAEGFLQTQAGKGTRVRETPERVTMRVGPGARITTRMPTEAERRELAIAEGTPLLVVQRGGQTELLPADRFALETVETVEAEAD